AVIDGSKGIYAAVAKTFRNEVVIQRCQWHKRENVVSYLKKEEQDYFRQRLQRAYEKPTYKEAKHALNLLSKELSLKNI
ncbi:transposase, partial [Streptococcus suis]|uniref:transposase n=1 Tax=Streptococcus suis TaxID=1307 RepID=UPI00370A2027